MSTEVSMGLAWLRAQIEGVPSLSTLAPGGIVRDVGPIRTAQPFVVLQHLSGADTTTHSGLRVLTRCLYLVKVVALDADTADSVYGTIDEALFLDVVTPVTGGAIHASSRESPIAYADSSVAGQTWTHSGGQYRLTIEKA